MEEWELETKRFKIGVSFTGTHREFVRQIVTALLNDGFCKDDIFFDEWHEELFNGADADIEFKSIYSKRCDCITVFLSKDYNDNPWTGGIEWNAIRSVMNTKNKKLCFLNVDNVDINAIDGLSNTTATAKKIDQMTAQQVAMFIEKRYSQIIEAPYRAETEPSEVITNLTAGNQFFSGRDEFFAIVHNAFNGENPVGEYAVYGKSGVGKSAFARAYALKFQTEYKDAIWWLDAEDISNGCREFLLKAGIADIPIDSDSIRESFLDWCIKHNSWLVIIDNAQDYNKVIKYTLGLARGHVLITTTDPFEFFGDFEQKLLDVFKENEVEAYVRRKFKERPGFSFETEANNIQSVANRLGFLPLAIVQAVSYIFENNLSFQTYDDYLTSFPEEMFDENEPRDHISLYKTVHLTYEQLHNEEQRQLLWLCSFLAPYNINKWMFVDGKSNMPQPFQEKCENPRSLDATFRYLNKLSLLEAMETESFSMHKLTQEIVRGIQKNDESCIIADFNMLTTEVKENRVRESDYQKFFVLATHAKQLYKHVVSYYNDAEFIEYHAIFGRLRDAYRDLASKYSTTCLYPEALEMNDEQLNVDILIAPDGGVDQAGSYLDRARILREAAKFDDAIENVNRAISLLSELRDANSEDFNIDELLDDTEKALSFVDRSISSFFLGSDVIDKRLGSAYNEMALILTAKGDGKAAEDAASKAEELLGSIADPIERELSRAATITNRGLRLRKESERADAIAEYDKALAIYDKLGLLDKNEEVVANLYNNMAVAYMEWGILFSEKAIEFADKAIAILEVIYPDKKHPMIGISYATKGQALMRLHRHEEALPYFERDIDICESVYAEPHPYLRIAYKNYGELFLVMAADGINPNQNCKKALDWLSKALDVGKRVLRETSRDTAVILATIGDVYLTMNDTATAKIWYRDAFNAAKSDSGQSPLSEQFLDICWGLWKESGGDEAGFIEWMMVQERLIEDYGSIE